MKNKLIKYDLVNIILDTDQTQLAYKLLEGRDNMYIFHYFVPAP